MARHYEARKREALKGRDNEAAERYRLWGLGFLPETEDFNTGNARRIVSASEAARLRAAEDEAKQATADAEHLAALKKKLGITPRANGSRTPPLRWRPSHSRQGPLTVKWRRRCTEPASEHPAPSQ